MMSVYVFVQVADRHETFTASGANYILLFLMHYQVVRFDPAGLRERLLTLRALERLDLVVNARDVPFQVLYRSESRTALITFKMFSHVLERFFSRRKGRSALETGPMPVPALTSSLFLVARVAFHVFRSPEGGGKTFAAFRTGVIILFLVDVGDVISQVASFFEHEGAGSTRAMDVLVMLLPVLLGRTGFSAYSTNICPGSRI